MTADQVWAAALSELQLQMTKATFDTWVRPTQAIGWLGDVLEIGVANEFAQDWLENRLRTTIERTLTGVVGQPVKVRFVVMGSAPAAMKGSLAEQAQFPPSGVVAVKFYEFDPRLKWGFLQASKYHYWFWQPYLGPAAWATYLFLRSLDKQNEGWGGWNFVSVDEIAATVVEKRRQKITGVQRKRKTGEKYWQKGAFDKLQDAGIAKVETFGGGNNISYRISVLNDLPLLVPEQVETLPEILQLKHARKIKECSLDYEEWQQLELPTLVH